MLSLVTNRDMSSYNWLYVSQMLLLGAGESGKSTVLVSCFTISPSEVETTRAQQRIDASLTTTIRRPLCAHLPSR